MIYCIVRTDDKDQLVGWELIDESRADELYTEYLYTEYPYAPHRGEVESYRENKANYNFVIDDNTAVYTYDRRPRFLKPTVEHFNYEKGVFDSEEDYAEWLERHTDKTRVKIHINDIDVELAHTAQQQLRLSTADENVRAQIYVYKTMIVYMIFNFDIFPEVQPVTENELLEMLPFVGGK